ncbi:hypothetical protein KIL84_003928 [Mauremys mutica]|uniref:NADH dehydrogenase [ubiquinone] 1 beta subcomplex subunit 8, mitochondrial n=1 Tax=Mauremys mutica TaxID=74926 RepID=A0A9D3WX12_9SAUR|nr:hypothetical protein KIL84_003928 [Mauremys mutica]
MAVVGVRAARWLRAATLLRAAGGRAAPLGARAASDLPKHLMPGPYPKTPEEKAAAAKKYNMRVEDYEPYPDDGMGYGDYPKLPDRSHHERDPWYQWDYPSLRQNWGEPMHWHFDMFLRTRVDTSPTVVSWHTMRNRFLLFIGFMLFMFWLGEMYPSYMPVVSNEVGRGKRSPKNSCCMPLPDAQSSVLLRLKILGIRRPCCTSGVALDQSLRSQVLRGT